MSAIIDMVASEFGDLSAIQATQFALRMLVAGCIAGLLGWERERMHKPAGLRTYVLVALGAVGFTAISHQAGFGSDAISRVLQGLTVGIGFLGAGCIMKPDGNGHVRGLTTAAGIWVTAAVGMAAGLGRLGSAIMLGVAGWFILAIIGRWERRIDEKTKPNNS